MLRSRETRRRAYPLRLHEAGRGAGVKADPDETLTKDTLGTLMKTEAELIATVATITDVSACERFAERAKAHGMHALAAACDERIRSLRPPRRRERQPMKTPLVAAEALNILIHDYRAGLPPITYGELARRCGWEGKNNARWFGHVTDLIDAACALSNVPSFALVRVREADGSINHKAWSKWNSHLRPAIVANAESGSWSDDDFRKIHDALALFASRGLGHQKAWEYVDQHTIIEDWAHDII